MLNKKRLAMMAVAASMVLPNNLVYLATNTPVFAEEGDSQEAEGPKAFSVDLLGTDGSLAKGSYKLTSETTLDQTILIKDAVTLDLNDCELSSSVKTAFEIQEGGFLKVIGAGTLKSTFAEKTDGAIFKLNGDKAQLTVEGTKDKTILTTDIADNTSFIYGISVMNTATDAKVNLTNVTMNKVQGGLTVHGNTPEKNAPLINLTDVNITAVTQTKNSQDPNDDSAGIYQAGASTINLVDCNLKSDRFAIQTRSGTLNILRGTIEGSKDVSPTVTANNSGSTTTYTGIAVDPHATKNGYKRPISINVMNATVSGYIPMILSNTANPVDNDNISIVLSNVTWDAAKDMPYVGYTNDNIKFTLVDCGEEDNVSKLTLSGIEVSVDSTVTNHANCTVITTSTGEDSVETTTTLSLPATDVQGIKIEDGVITDPDAKKQVEESLTTQANNNQPEFLNPIDPETGEPTSTPQKLDYKYTVTINGAAISKTENGTSTYAFPAALTAELNPTSVVRLLIPKKVSTENQTALLENASADDSATGVWDSSKYIPVDVELNKVLDSTNTTIDSDTITKLLGNISSLTDKYDDTAKFEFKSFKLDGTYPVADTTSPISFVATPQTSAPVYTGPSGHKKPTKPAEEPMEPVATPTPIYRLYNRLNGEHLYTLDKNEKDNLLTSDTWKDEGQAWIAPSESNYPVYRLLNPNNGDHHYTMDKNEFDTLPSYGWTAEGIAFFSADVNNPENIILHRLYNPNETGAGSHLYTVDTNERDTLEGLGWKYEGTAWAALPETK